MTEMYVDIIEKKIVVKKVFKYNEKKRSLLHPFLRISCYGHTNLLLERLVVHTLSFKESFIHMVIFLNGNSPLSETIFRI